MSHTIQKPKTFTVIDPREFDGDAYQVAQRAVAQAKALTEILIEILDATDKMARNAELERLLAAGIDSKSLRDQAHAWATSPQGKQFAVLAAEAENIVERLGRLEKAVAYNPKTREARR